MKWIRKTREVIQDLKQVRSRYGDLLSEQRGWLYASGAMLAGEILCQIILPWPMKYIVDGVLVPSTSVQNSKLYFVPEGYLADPANHMTFTLVVCAVLLAATLLGGFFSYYRQIWSATAGQRMVLKLRKRLYQHLNQLSLKFHKDQRIGDLIMRITGDIPMLRDVLSDSFIDIIGRVVLLFSFLGLIFWLQPQLALACVGVLTLVSLMSALFGRRIVKVARKQRKAEGIIAFTAGETLSAISLVKAYGREDEVARRFGRKNRASMRAGLKGTRLQAALSRWVELLFAVGVVVVLFFGVRMVMENRMSPGDLILFISYVRNLNKPLRAMSRLSSKVGKAAACGERIGEILSIEPEEIDLPEAVVAPPLAGNIEFKNIGFEYDDGVAALQNINIDIKSGERVGLVGRNGAGKTTLMHLLLRFYEPTTGSIELDGAPLTAFTIASVREQLSMALQSTFLFGMSIRENLLFAAPDATEEDMIEALNAVAAEFVFKLPQGLETEINEGGSNFSGGECRKIALAGALLRRTPILILDEPTTYIDRASRSDLLERLPGVTVGQTTLVITHDPEMLRWFDRVIYLEEGKIAAIGDHGELQSSSVGYQALFPKAEESTASSGGSPTGTGNEARS